ncbi:MAG: DUF3822 family protein [Bacteroidia bacterium]|nr:DUF3822 family protein [Bacteroidia bacterium]MDW8346372.1 DUF3822 family protein [Bacteroidia bacterium]
MSLLNSSTVSNFHYKSGQKHDLGECETQVQLDSDGIHFGVFYGSDCVQFASYQFHTHVSEGMRHEIAIKYIAASLDKFRKVSFLYQAPKFLFVPDALWQKDTLVQDFMVVNDYFPELETLHKKVFQSHRCTFIYTLPIEYSKNFKYLEQDIDIRLSAVELIAYYDKYFKSKQSETDVVLHIQTNNIEMACFKEGKWVHYNQFKYDAIEDMLYYVLFTMEQLGFSLENTRVYVQGRIEKVGNVYQILFKYLPQIDMISCPHDSYAAYLPNYHHFPLFFER